MRYFVPIYQEKDTHTAKIIIFKDNANIGLCYPLPGFHHWKCDLSFMLGRVENKQMREITPAEAALIL